MLIRELEKGDPEVCRKILHALPEWFGRQEANAHYIDHASNAPMLIADIEQPVGFASLKRHNAHTYEIYVMGVLPRLHRRGVGTNLLIAVEKFARRTNARYLTVKTLSLKHPDPNYAQTRMFYAAFGFEPLEEFPTLWGENTPCLMMIKVLDSQRL